MNLLFGGFAPATPSKTKTKPFYEGKTETSYALPLVGTEGLRLRAGLWKSLAQTGYERVQLTHVLGAARWPVLKWPRMAGFEVATEGRVMRKFHSRMTSEANGTDLLAKWHIASLLCWPIYSVRIGMHQPWTIRQFSHHVSFGDG